MPNYLGGGPLVATDPNRFIQNYNQTRQVDLQVRQQNRADKELLLEEMQKKAEADKQRDIKEALEEASSLFGDDWGKIPDTLRYGYLTAVHAMDRKSALEWLVRIDKWKNEENIRAQRGQSAQQLFKDQPGMQTAFQEGGMEDAKRYSDIMRGPESAIARPFGTQASDFKIVTLATDPSGKQMPPGKGYRYQAIPDPSRSEGFRLHPLGPAEDTRTSTNIVIGQDESGNIITVPSRGEPIPKKTPMGLKPGEQLQPKVAPTVPTEQIVALQQIDTLKEALGQVTDLYDESFVGPIAGPAGKVADDWGIMPNAKRSEFRALTANLYNTIIYLRSGKQINEEEAKRLLSELPTMNVSPVAFQAKLKKFTWELNSIERGRKRQLKGAGYRNVPEEGAGPEGTPQGGPTVVERRRSKSGKILEKLSDGTIREVK